MPYAFLHIISDVDIMVDDERRLEDLTEDEEKNGRRGEKEKRRRGEGVT